MNLDTYLNKALIAAIEAGDYIREIYKNDFDITLKSDNSPVTIADIGAQKLINKILADTPFPIIGEEQINKPYFIRKKWDYCWLVDPLDGTKEFAHKNGEFTVNIALIHKQVPILGIIYAPISNELFVGNCDKESYTQKNITSLTDLKKSPKIDLAPKFNTVNPRFGCSKSHINKKTKQYIQQFKNFIFKPIGSSLKFCRIVEGKIDSYPRFGRTMEWDSAAGHAICRSLGIDVIDPETGKELVYNKENLENPNFMVNHKWTKKLPLKLNSNE